MRLGLFYSRKVKGENNMLAKTIKYTDYNGVERKETHYFNYNKAEIA